jgi:Nucleotide-diphospho-sugar transferase
MYKMKSSTIRACAYFAIIVFSLLISFFVITPLYQRRKEKNPFRRNHVFERVCPETGSESAAPKNHAALSEAIATAVLRIQSRNKNSVIISSTVNKEAAKENMIHFMESLLLLTPPMLFNTIIFCLDKWSCHKCAALHLDPALCLYMDLGVSEESLAPLLGSKEFSNRSYWRLTYGRVFTTLRIHSQGVSVLPVDVDAVFLNNPFAATEEISERPDSIAAVIDSIPFELSTGDTSLLINGGFLYFPATTPKASITTNNVLQKIWSQSCMAENEQVVTTHVLKELYNTTSPSDPTRPRILNHEKYLNFCNLPCGSNEFKFNEILSLEDLHTFEKNMHNRTEFKLCAKENRKKWVFFHAACIKWHDGHGRNLAKNKGKVQQAILQWVREST